MTGSGREEAAAQAALAALAALEDALAVAVVVQHLAERPEQADSVLAQLQGLPAAGGPGGGGQAPNTAVEMPGVTDTRFIGTIISYDAQKGFGFIKNEELKECFGKDVFLHREQIGWFGIGSAVSFGVFLNMQGQPQARDLEAAVEEAAFNLSPEAVTLPPPKLASSPKLVVPPLPAQAPQSSAEMPGVTDRRFQGTIFDMKPERGFGWIRNDELRVAFGKDVFLHSKQVGPFRENDVVTFGVFLNKDGHPAAKELSGQHKLAVPVPPPPPPPAVAMASAAPQTSVEMPGVTDRLFEGTIISLSMDKGFGFISNPELRAYFGKDVFLHQKQVGPFKEGDVVSYAVFLNKDGHPAARDLNAPRGLLPQEGFPSASGGLGAAPESLYEFPGVTDQRFMGQIVQYQVERGFGFIHCKELFDIFNKDVFLHSKQIGAFGVGNIVTFGVFLNKQEQPQAKDLCSAEGGQGPIKLAPQTSAEMPGVTDRRFSGRITNFDVGRGFGFVICPELHNAVGKDAFLHKDQIGSFSEGSVVSFAVFLNKNGQPQAKDLAGSASPGMVQAPGIVIPKLVPQKRPAEQDLPWLPPHITIKRPW